MALTLGILITMIAPRVAHGQGLPLRADTVRLRPPQLALPSFLSPFPGRSGSGPDSVGQIGLKAVPLLVPISFDAPAIVTDGPTPSLAPWVVGRGPVLIRRRMELRRRDFFAGGSTRPPSAGGPAAFPLVSGLAGLDFEIVGQGELGGDWTRYRPCDTQVQFSCQPNLFPQLNPDLQFAVRAAGRITERIRLDVDFDQAREFSATNEINIFYEGDDDAVVRTLSLGDVTFALPESRFLTQGIPAGNFGFLLSGQAGPMDFSSVWAQQRGDVSSREFRLSGAVGQESFVQVDTLVLDDADYVKGQFFFVLDPAEIDRSPHIDIQALDPSMAPLNIVPGVDPIQFYRFETDPVTRQQVDGLIQADAFASAGGVTVQESGWFRFLQPGVDYTMHSSGLWVALSRPLGPDEMLAVTYVSATGDTIGTYNPEQVYNAGGRPRLELLKASSANHRPGRPTWDREMHQVYRVSSSPDVDPGSVELSISLGEASAGRTFTRDLAGRDVTFLRLFGLDEESPVDVLDPSGLYRATDEFLQEQPIVPGVFVVFPTLRPFESPPPVPVLGLTAEQAAQILGADGNPTIYEAEDPFLRESGGLYRLNIPFELRSRGVISSFSLGALGIRDGSERIFLGDRLLTRDMDYTIDYTIGQVTLTQPEVLFATASEPVVRAAWEQKAIFQVTPTTVFGFNGGFQAGAYGGFNVLALHQRQQALVNRPQLGTEPAAITLSGLSMDFDFPAIGLDRLLENVPALRVGRPSRIGLEGELALSLPNPNIRSDVFLDDFDASNETALSLDASDWVSGSAPAFRDGAETVLPPSLDESDAGRLVWQHTWVIRGIAQDSVGVFAGFLPEVDIDQQISVTGSQARESGFVMSFTPRALGLPEPSWRSVTTSLSETGMDLSKTESLEFYAADGDSLTLVIDLGVVAEDAFFFDTQGRTTGVKENGAPWGLGRLDHEADPRLGEVWSDDADQRGVWGEACRSTPGAVYNLGDPRANCTRGNGREDTEDLDGDGNLDGLERYLRFTVPLDGSSPFLARTQAETGTEFQLYRIPIRGSDVTEVPGVFSEADFRAVKHMRFTVSGRRSERVTLSRLRFVGAHWAKRTDSGVMDGIVGDTVSLFGRAEVGPVSTVTEGNAYQAPPGVIEELDDPTAAFGGLGTEFNEKGLKLEYEGVQPGSRAEVYNRFPQRPRDFLAYQELKLWAVARRGDWGVTDRVSFFVKVGEDAENFYLYRTPLFPAPNPNQISPEDWLPEIIIDFGKWIDLRRQAEEDLIFSSGGGPGDPPTVVWSPDSTYAVVLKDRARAPNLAAVRELSIGVWNSGDFATTGEVWINEMRLSSPLKDAGMASHVALDIDASDVWTTRVAVSNRGGLYRQLVETPSFQGERIVTVGSTFNLDRMAPAGSGVEIPVTVTHVTASQDPHFLSGSDIRANNVRDLRETGSRSTRVDVGFRKRTPAANPVIGLLLDGLEARIGYFTASSSTITSEGSAEGADGHVGYGRSVARRDFGIVPGFLEPALRWLLPRAWEGAVIDSRFRWSPERFSLGASYALSNQRTLRFDQIVELPGDSLIRATRSPREALEGAFEIVFRPFRTLSAQADMVSIRDLLDSERVITDPDVRDLLDAERLEVAGIDLGWQTNQALRTRYGFEPRFGDWVRTALGWQTFYSMDRSATFVNRTQDPVGDTVVSLVRNVNGRRDFTGQVTVIPSAVVGSFDGGPAESTLGKAVKGIFASIDPITVTYQDGVTSRFDRDPVDPSASYRFGFADRHDYRVIGADTATTLTDRGGWTVRTSARLPAAFQMGVTYRLITANTLDTRSDRTLRRETWPDLNLSLAGLPLPDNGFLRRANLSAGFQRIRQRTAFGGFGQQERFQRDSRVPFEIALVWGGGLSTSYRGSITRGEGGDPTGATERNRGNHTVSISAAMRPPARWAARLTRPVMMSALFQYASDRNCRTTAALAECVPFLDELIRSVVFRVETAVARTDVRLQLSYTDRQSFVGLQSGSSQFQFGLFGRFVIADDALFR